jgi:hypothetical protein
MPNMPIAPPAGLCLSAADYAVGQDAAFVPSGASAYRQGKGRWVAANNVEFIAGFPQKIAGWSQATMAMTKGIPRAVAPWRDNEGGARVAIGTETHLYYFLAGVLNDITPLRTTSSGTLTNPLTTTNNSNIVAVADSSQVLVNGDWVFLSAASAVGGLTIDGWFQVSSRTGTGYNVTVPNTATSGAGPGGGTTAFQYPRVTLTNPFTTVSGSGLVTVAHTANGSVAGNYVVFSGGSSVGGLTISGEYQIISITDANDYVIMAGSNATSSTTGGGSVSVIYDIQVQQISNSAGASYGQGNYGVGAYGVGTTQVPLLGNGWTLSAYGSQMLACPIGGTIYVYDPMFGGRAYPLLNAPSNINAMFVTPERFVVALGVNGAPLQMAWADQNDYTDWTTTPTNTANTGRNLIGGSFFVGGIGIRDGVSLIWTDRVCFQMNYSGGQEIYSTPQIGDNCGLVSPTAACVEGGVAYWMSDQDLWSWNGGVTVLTTDDIRAFIFQGGINRASLTKCTVGLTRAKRQVRFFFPSTSAMENDGGMIYQYDQNCFSQLGFGRTAVSDAELFPTPISTDTNGLLYFDETGTDANGTPLASYLELSEIDLSNGDKNLDVFGFLPNFETLTGTACLTILTRYYPADPANVDGPFPMTSATQRQDLRSDGKMFSFGISSNDMGATFRLGVPRVDVQPSGARR